MIYDKKRKKIKVNLNLKNYLQLFKLKFFIRVDGLNNLYDY